MRRLTLTSLITAALLGIAVPALLYLIGWAWQRLRGRQEPCEK